MKQALFPGVLLIATLGTVAYWYFMVRPASVEPGRDDPPRQTTLFAPDACAFQVRMAGKPATSRQMRGELPIEIATAKHAGIGAVKVSCGPYLVQDMQAFEAHLPAQMRQAARQAGLKQVKTEVTRNGDWITASYQGVRGEGDYARHLRSETHVRDQQFVELLYMVPASAYDTTSLRALARIESPQ